MPAARVVVVDNHDSFTFNLVQLIGQLTGEWPHVVTHDACIDDVGLDWATHVILSPGPGRPDRAGDVGVCAEIVERARVPVLGVCLGHQLLAVRSGARVGPAVRVVHGYRSPLGHVGRGLFRGVPDGVQVVRYHSLAVAEEGSALPADLEVLARARDDGTIMALGHRTRPLWSVQFHPESVATDAGAIVMENFLASRSGARFPATVAVPAAVSAAREQAGVDGEAGECRRERELHVQRVPGAAGCAEALFLALFAGEPGAFWLDSAAHGVGSAQCSYLGAADDEIRATTRDALDVLRAVARDLATRSHAPVDLPFDFRGGYVGALSYELGHVFGLGAPADPDEPVVRLLRVERFVAIDHDGGDAYVVAAGDEVGCRRWIDGVVATIARAPTVAEPGAGDVVAASAFAARTPAPVYRQHIDRCLEAIRTGESYELCLTTKLEAPLPAHVSPVALYRRLRRGNPAPYGALMRFGDVDVLSSSPELFLRMDEHGQVVSKPIKGTRRRDADATTDAALRRELAESGKDRAENLMIADLVRNDLGRVCELGSVVCQPLMAIESFATVHQMVTTVRGQLRADVDLVGLLAATFPGGSMTGAPKRRSMDILHQLEDTPRGIYSGALGYFSVGGACALSMAIRTAVVRGGSISVGAGGAIVAASDPEDELAEVAHKAKAVTSALAGESSDARPTSPGRAHVEVR